jgi:phosphatidate cytidylyltransferase
MSNFMQRILTGSALAVTIITLVVMGPYSFIFLVAVINCLGVWEFYRLFQSYTRFPRALMGSVLSLSLLATFTLFVIQQNNGKVLLVNIPMAFSIFVAELYLKATTPFQNLAFTFLGLLCITVPLCFFISIAFHHSGFENYHFQLVLGYFLILWANDSGAYFIGKFFGRHHLFERISPKKTWEGSFGGLTVSLLTVVLASRYLTILQLADRICIALIIVVSGTFGDFIKSLMKRSLHIKDTGTILPGHGGILDRFDTLLGSAPFVFAYLALFNPSVK